MTNRLFGGNNIKKKIKVILNNLTENENNYLETSAIINKNKITYIDKDIKHTIITTEDKINLIRENKEFKNILTFSPKRSILSEYIIKNNDICVEIMVKTLEFKTNDDEIYIKYQIQDSNNIYEYKIMLED